MPQERFKDAGTTPLNRYDGGPFCKFNVPKNMPFQGVYLLTVSGAVRYVGECENVSQRFGPQGYGSIQPRNCFVGGQATNCKINNLILQNCRLARDVELWFHKTDDRKRTEAHLIQEISPEWIGRIWQ